MRQLEAELERATSVQDVLEIRRKLASHETQLDDSALALCERLLPRLNVKDARELSELIVRRWPDSPYAQRIAANSERKAAERRRTASASLRDAIESRRVGMAYWLKVTGTGEEPFDRRDWAVRHESWRRQYGSVSMFPRRPNVKAGHRFVCYAAGSHTVFGEGRIYLVEEVVSDRPEPSPHERWNWMVRTRRLIAGPGLERCPRITEIDVERGSLRRHSHIHLTDEQGINAEKLIAQAAERHGALLRLRHASEGEHRGRMS
jgi:hypothetical protein